MCASLPRHFKAVLQRFLLKNPSRVAAAPEGVQNDRTRALLPWTKKEKDKRSQTHTFDHWLPHLAPSTFEIKKDEVTDKVVVRKLCHWVNISFRGDPESKTWVLQPKNLLKTCKPEIFNPEIDLANFDAPDVLESTWVVTCTRLVQPAVRACALFATWTSTHFQDFVSLTWCCGRLCRRLHITCSCSPPQPRRFVIVPLTLD